MKKRVAIITDASEHLGPHLAAKLAARDHDLILGGVTDKRLVNKLQQLGAHVEVVRDITGPESLEQPGAVELLTQRAQNTFGGFQSAFIRPGVHIVGDILCATGQDFQKAFEGNMLSTVYALQALLPPLIEQKEGGQILICTSATSVKPYAAAVAYSSTRAGANMIIQSAAQTAAPHGITINALGTMFMNYPGFLDNSGCRDPEVLKAMQKNIPLNRLGEPHEAAHIAASLLDGESNYISGEFISVSGGWTNS